LSYTPDQGDIVWLDFDPSAGQEIMKNRPALVISKQVFNDATGFAVVVPITSTDRGLNLEVSINGQTETKGVAVVPQVRSIDFEARKAVFREKAPRGVTEQVVKYIQLITQI